MNGIGYQSGLLLPIHDKDTLYNIFGNMFRHKTASYRHQTRIEKIKKKTKLRLVSFLYFIYIYRNCLHLHIQSKVNRYKANLFFQFLQTFHFLCFQELIDTTKMFFYRFYSQIHTLSSLIRPKSHDHEIQQSMYRQNPSKLVSGYLWFSYPSDW